MKITRNTGLCRAKLPRNTLEKYRLSRLENKFGKADRRTFRRNSQLHAADIVVDLRDLSSIRSNPKNIERLLE